MTGQSDPGTIDAANPWPGLASFREEDSGLFVGREREADELFRLVARERLTVLFGLSGLGKTSLVQAGLFPRLREENILPVPLRIDYSDGAASFRDQVLAALGQAAAAAGAEIPAARPDDTLWEYFHRTGNEIWSARNRPLVPLLSFDQFEEVFTLGQGRPATAGILADLASLTEGHPPTSVKARLDAHPEGARELSFGRHPYKILLSLREDFLPDLESLRGRIRTLGNNRLRVRRMTGDNALRVVILPGRSLVDPDVAEHIVRFVAGGDMDTAETREEGETPLPELAELEVEPALLSIICRELNTKRLARGEAKISTDLLVGSRTEILTDFYERSVADLGPEVRHFLEERMLTVSGFRDSVALENALAVPGVTRAALDRLTERRLLRVEDRGNGQRLELTHDVLTGVVRASRDSRRQREALERAAAESLALQEQQKRMRRELRHSRRALIVFAVLLVIAVGLSITTLRAKKRTSEALATSDVERALNLQEGRSQGALACLAHALRLDPQNFAARSLLFDLILHRSWLLPVFQVQHEEALEVELSPDGRTTALVTLLGQVRLAGVLTGPGGADRVLPAAEAVSRAVFSGDGRRLLLSGRSGTEVWDLAAGRPQGAPFPSRSLACLGAACAVLAEEHEGVTRFLDTVSHAEVGPAVRSDTLRTLASPDGERLLRVERRGGGLVLLIHDIRSGRPVGAPLPLDPQTTDVSMSPDGAHLAAVQGHHVGVWDAATRAPLALLDHEAQVLTARFTAAGLLLTDSADNGVRVWDVRSGRLLMRAERRSGLHTASVSGDGATLLTVTEDRTLRLWDVRSGRPLFEPVHDVADARIWADGRYVTTVAENGLVRVLEPVPAARSVIARSVGRGGRSGPGGPGGGGFTNADILDDGARLVALEENGTLVVRETRTGHQVGFPLRGLTGVRHVHLVSGGDRVAVIETARAFVWDYRAGRIVSQVAIPDVAGASTGSEIGPSGRTALIVRSPSAVQMMDLATGKPLTGLLSHQAQWDGPVPFSPDGGRFLLTPSEEPARVLETRSGRTLARLTVPGRLIEWAIFSPDGRRVLAIGRDRTVRLWDAETGRQIHEIRNPHGGGFTDAVFGRDGSILAVGKDFRVMRWDARQGDHAGERLLAPEIWYLQFAPDDPRILVATKTSARLWEADTGRPLGSEISLGGEILDTAFSPDGDLLFIASRDAFGIWDIPVGSPDDAAYLARWADTLSGFRLDEHGGLEALPNPIRLRNELRRDTLARKALGARTLIRWFFTPPGQRPPRPPPPPPPPPGSQPPPPES